MPGYDINRFVGMSANEKIEFMCSICQDILRDPVVTSCCLQSFCDHCIVEWLQTSKVCPYDRKALATDQLSRAPRALTNLLGKLKIRCDYRDNGCQQVIDLESLSNHSQHCQHNPNKVCEKCFSSKPDHDCVKYLLDTNNEMAIELNESRITNRELIDMSAKLVAAYNRLYDYLDNRKMAFTGNASDSSLSQLNSLTFRYNPSTSITTGRSFKTDKKFAVIKVDMCAEMRDEALNVTQQALQKHDVKCEKIEMLAYIRMAFERKYGVHWNCLFGDLFVYDFAYAPKHYIFFAYGSMSVILFKSPK